MRICFFGDSFVNGTGDDQCLGWVGRLCSAERQKGRDLTMYNLGIRRDTSADVRRRWRREAAARLPPDCEGRLVFSFGLNDSSPSSRGAAPRVAARRTLEDARTVLSGARAWLPTLMVGPPPITESAERNARIVELSDQLQGVCDDLGVAFFSTVSFAQAGYEAWRAEADAGDGIHPNAGSYAALADVIGGWAGWREWFAE
jgi:acyl-CoA thioesterase-1